MNERKINNFIKKTKNKKNMVLIVYSQKKKKKKNGNLFYSLLFKNFNSLKKIIF